MYQFKKYSKLSGIKNMDCIQIWLRGDGFILRMNLSFEAFQFKNVWNTRHSISMYRNGHFQWQEPWPTRATLGFKSPLFKRLKWSPHTTKLLPNCPYQKWTHITKLTVAFHNFASMPNNGKGYTLLTLYSQSHALHQLKTSKNTQHAKLLFVTFKLKWLVWNRISIHICISVILIEKSFWYCYS